VGTLAKKTALLQILASLIFTASGTAQTGLALHSLSQKWVVCWLVRFANALFCALAVCIFLSYCSKIPLLLVFLRLCLTVRLSPEPCVAPAARLWV